MTWMSNLWLAVKMQSIPIGVIFLIRPRLVPSAGPRWLLVQFGHGNEGTAGFSLLPRFIMALRRVRRIPVLAVFTGPFLLQLHLFLLRTKRLFRHFQSDCRIKGHFLVSTGRKCQQILCPVQPATRELFHGEPAKTKFTGQKIEMGQSIWFLNLMPRVGHTAWW